MIRRSTWILLAIFVIVAAGTFFWQRTNNVDGGDPSVTPQATPVAVFDFEAGSVVRVQIANTAQGVSYERQADGTWQYAVEPASTGEPSLLPADGGEILNRLMQLASLTALNVLSSPPDASLTGLAAPAFTAILTLESGSTVRVEAGASTATGRGYYARFDGAAVPGGTVLVVAKPALDAILALLQTPPLVTPVLQTPAIEATAVP